ncbi:hypothetical protein J7T55_001781 [Diaporthe amygdali]|uniref:uncharacterized protein n=1 Tax=Phomopsis amygdali TaxID=1214568 RepID=UPI0022FE1F25|nr:uncharacterized protein J7T55_001781 [Diaporthe amygdali]KAJ0117583.1 hypothetical protein J7T55_001781 [Diaporthe amygdali]
MEEGRSTRLSNNPYRASMMLDNAPSVDVPEQMWIDSVNNILGNVESNRLSNNPYRMSIVPEAMAPVAETDSNDDPSVDVAEQTWSDSATNIPEDDVAVAASLNGSYHKIPPPDIAKTCPSSVPEAPSHLSKRVIRKIKRLIHKRGNEIEMLTVFTKHGAIVCSYESSKEPHYTVHSSEGQYLGLALELGFKQEGCPFEFGSVNWLSGTQEEVEDKMTLLASPDGEHPGDGKHQFYGVLSPTGRYVFAAVLREGSSGALGLKSMRKMRDLADKLEVYEAWAGSGGLISKIAAKL